MPDAPASRPFNYFNAGVMLVGRAHRNVFTLPSNPGSGSMSEQAYTNLKVMSLGFKFHDLGIKWNGLHSIRGPENRKDLHVIHYAGWPKTSDWVDTMIRQMRVDLGNWS
jgi:hypothetical protein